MRFKIIGLFVLSTILIYLSIHINFFNVAPKEWYSGFQKNMEDFVVDRLFLNADKGVWYKGGLLLQLHSCGEKHNPADTKQHQYRLYDDNNAGKNECVNIYFSHIGGQAFFYYLLDRIFKPVSNIYFLRSICAFLTAVCLSLIVLWFYVEFNLIVALCVLLSFITCQWIVAFGNNLYWSLWAFFVPFVGFLYLSSDNCLSRYRINSPVVVFVYTFIFLVTKIVFTSYEYITTSVLIIYVPLFYGIKRNHSDLKTAIPVIMSSGMASLLAIFFGFCLLSMQIAEVQGSVIDGFNHIYYSFLKRTSGAPNQFPEVYSESLSASHLSVLWIYIKGWFVDLNRDVNSSGTFLSKIVYKIRYLYLIIVFILSAVTIKQLQKKDIANNKSSSLISAFWLSFVPPLSWFIIFKAHSFIHHTMNFIIWQMPMTIFGFALIGYLISLFINTSKLK